nr:MAG TPA: tail fiber protein [Caudoviricetes sp.]
MDKTFTFTLDAALPVNPQNKFELWRGDNVVFNFVFKSGGEDMTIPEGTKLRIFAKKVGANSLVDKADTPLFAADFDTPATASFNSSQTSGDAGNYLLAVMLMTADTSIITAQGIYFDLLENGYAGIYQPSPDFRDDVLDALNKALAAAAAAAESATQSAESAGESATSAQSAETAKTGAQTAQTNAETAAASAAEKATAAAQSATASANSAAQSATSAQSADAARTAAETAAEVAQSTDAGQLMLTKTPQGFLAFTATGTTQAVLAKQTKLTKAFSLCFTFIAPDSVPSSLSSGTWLCYSMGDPTQAAQVGFVVQWTTWWDNKAQQGFIIGIKNKTDAAGSNNRLFLPYSTVSDGKPHAVAIIASPDSSVSTDGNNGKIRAYVDGVLQASTDAFVADTDNQNSRFTFSNTFGRLARMCRFNFDISAADAPYTLADYTSGKAIPAALYAPFNFSADGSTWEPMKMSDNTTLAPATVSVAGDVITITTTAEISEAFFRIKPTTDIIKGVAGQTLHASIESFSGIGDSRGLGVKPMINDGEVGQINLTTNTKSGTWSMDRPFNSVNLTIRYGTSPIPSGTVFTITGLRVWTNGSVVALDDYTFGGKIRDISGNDNHATVSTTNGVRIHGDKDEAVQQMYEAFSAQYTTDNP